jgi:hypothetical protein
MGAVVLSDRDGEVDVADLLAEIETAMVQRDR